MIYGIGTDIVQISRIEKTLQERGDRFLRRVFTDAEIEYCSDKATPAARFALRFAAKEAFLKALGLGVSQGLGLHHVEVLRMPTGAPKLDLHGKARELCEGEGIRRTFLSLSDDGLYAIAMVVLEV
ncbi:MAG: holo-ACP synthase [Thermodesulfobacteriota bacterium]|nr:holo-ACP synthase [Thermodesulfobacteriota bacterium]